MDVSDCDVTIPGNCDWIKKFEMMLHIVATLHHEGNHKVDLEDRV